MGAAGPVAVRTRDAPLERRAAVARLPDPTPYLDAHDRAAFDRMLAHRRRHGVGLYGPYLTLMYDTPLAEHVEALGRYLKFESTLPRPVFQFVVLAVARLTGAEFEWRDHVDHARAAGLPEPVITTLAGVAPGAPADVLADLSLPEPFAAVAGVLSASFAHHDIPADAQQRLVDQVGTGGLVEVVVLAGFYGMIGMVNAGFDVALDDAGRQ
jgi:4-carboxymuconolactone decarboxylase